MLSFCAFLFWVALFPLPLQWFGELYSPAVFSLFSAYLVFCVLWVYCVQHDLQMRPIPEERIEEVVRITSFFVDCHGAPVHIGDPSAIGAELCSHFEWFLLFHASLSGYIEHCGVGYLVHGDGEVLCCDCSVTHWRCSRCPVFLTTLMCSHERGTTAFGNAILVKGLSCIRTSAT